MTFDGFQTPLMRTVCANSHECLCFMDCCVQGFMVCRPVVISKRQQKHYKVMRFIIAGKQITSKRVVRSSAGACVFSSVCFLGVVRVANPKA